MTIDSRVVAKITTKLIADVAEVIALETAEAISSAIVESRSPRLPRRFPSESSNLLK